ncbi:MAG TPA: NUDIX hydrolase, partial [Burkholderiaceae bacterium]|nr:NUDIX hydrolase [Burkholderiaceae bacterium]
LNNPAGHLDPGESLQQAVEREVLEETARAFVPDALVGVYLARFQRPPSGARIGESPNDEGDVEDVTYLRFAFRGSVADPQPGRALDEGIVRTVWMTPEEVRASVERHRSPLVLRCIEDHLAGRRFPLEMLQAHPSLYAPWIPG